MSWPNEATLSRCSRTSANRRDRASPSGVVGPVVIGPTITHAIRLLRHLDVQAAGPRRRLIVVVRVGGARRAGEGPRHLGDEVERDLVDLARGDAVPVQRHLARAGLVERDAPLVLQLLELPGL